MTDNRAARSVRRGRRCPSHVTGCAGHAFSEARRDRVRRPGGAHRDDARRGGAPAKVDDGRTLPRFARRHQPDSRPELDGDGHPRRLGPPAVGRPPRRRAELHRPGDAHDRRARVGVRAVRKASGRGVAALGRQARHRRGRRSGSLEAGACRRAQLAVADPGARRCRSSSAGRQRARHPVRRRGGAGRHHSVGGREARSAGPPISRRAAPCRWATASLSHRDLARACSGCSRRLGRCSSAAATSCSPSCAPISCSGSTG